MDHLFAYKVIKPILAYFKLVFTNFWVLSIVLIRYNRITLFSIFLRFFRAPLCTVKLSFIVWPPTKNCFLLRNISLSLLKNTYILTEMPSLKLFFCLYSNLDGEPRNNRFSTALFWRVLRVLKSRFTTKMIINKYYVFRFLRPRNSICKNFDQHLR